VLQPLAAHEEGLSGRVSVAVFRLMGRFTPVTPV
jgi:hypothetical protein